MKIMSLENLEFELTFSFTAHVGAEMSKQFTNCKIQILCNKLFCQKKKLSRLSQVYRRIKVIFIFQFSHTVLCNFATVLSSSPQIRSLLKYHSELWNLPVEVF